LPFVKLSVEQVRSVAALARLELAAGEVESLREDLSAILTYVEKLAKLETEAVAPTSHVVSIEPSFREDEVTNRPAPEDALANAPERDRTFFVVPSIIE
jgi:aspartyl-tRNA(Asn)/glutamyl-tRNA(Gln) amidotransferase subunit C